jgi:hypothetical protein
MQTQRLIGLVLFFLMAMIAFGLFGVGDVQDRPAKYHPSINATNVSTGPEISAYRGVTLEEQVEVCGFGIGMIIGLLAFVYIGGIAYNEYDHIKDLEKEPEE